jgi:inorganic pyrophosphatase
MSRSPVREKTFADDAQQLVHIVIETPAGSRTKYAWNPDAQAFVVRKVLPLGATFPYDFGFVVGTRAPDGDPLDALVLADEPLVLGCLVVCRILGAIECKTSKPGEELRRNDRLIAVPVASIAGAAWQDLPDLGDRLVREIADFLADYTRREGGTFELLGTARRAAALVLVRDAQQ